MRQRARYALVCLGMTVGCGPEITELASGFDIEFGVRPALSQDGTVVAAESAALLISDGSTLSTLDLSSEDLDLTASNRKAVQVRDAGDIVFVAARAGTSCVGSARGAYRIATAGGAVSTLRETCTTGTSEPRIGFELAMSPNGTVAVSDIQNGAGAIWRGPVAGPLTQLHAGSGELYNTGAIDVNDAGRTPVQMEYFDGFAGGLMRAVLVFDTLEQPKADLDTVIEKMGIGSQPPHAINASGTAVLSIGAMTITIGGVPTSYVAGVYRATPTQFNTPKMLALVADLAGPYCRFGNVDINDDGDVAFEAALDAGTNCASASFDGLFRGPDPVKDRIVVREDEKLGDHRYFDSIRLGELNNADQVSFLTSYSEPLVEPVKLWRADL
jgi:hypothetical protein